MSTQNAVNEHITNPNTNPELNCDILDRMINASKNTKDGTVIVRRSVVVEEHTSLSTDDLMKLKDKYRKSCSEYAYQGEEGWMKTTCFHGMNASDVYGFDGDNHYVDTLSFHLDEDGHRWGNPIVEI